MTTIQISSTEESQRTKLETTGATSELVPKKDIDEIFEIYQDRKVTDFKEYKTLDGLLEKLGVNKATGLDMNNEKDLQKRRSMYSVIEDVIKKQPSILEFIMNALEDLMLRLLVVVAFISITLGVIENGWGKGWIEGASILLSVVIVVSIQSFTDYKKQKQFAVLHKIQQVSEHETKRNGHIHIINVKDWVVGDIIQLTPGCIPKADGILLTCDIPVQTDESSLSGENEAQHKEIGSCIFEGCPVVDGYGEMLVLRLGKDSCQGKIKQHMLDNSEDETPLQQKLEVMANQIGTFALYSALLTFSTLISYQIYSTYTTDDCFYCVGFFQHVVRHLMVGFGIIIMAIPEGLPLSVTIALAYSVHQMYIEKNLVKKLKCKTIIILETIIQSFFLSVILLFKACETMGGVSDICTDKTGTLTYGNMELKKVFMNANTLPIDSIQNNASTTKELLLRIIQNTSKAIVDLDEQGLIVKKGNITEIALIKWVMQQQQSRQFYNLQKIREFPFTSKNRCSGTIVNHNGSTYLYLKGQPDSVLPNCDSMLFNDEQIEFNSENKQRVEKSIEEYTNQAYRCLVFAVKKLDGFVNPSKNRNNEAVLSELLSSKGFTFVGMCYLQDEVRVEVPKAVKQLKNAGVTTRMITGDSQGTARAVAIECGIILEGEDSAITTGYQIAQMTEKQLNECVDTFKVVAKCSPEQKLKFVKALKSQGKVVAVTGDGTNDAPCFQVSDVSFTMGKNGTEIIKEAGDIILLDDNYASIVTSCSWGRNILEGIRKFLVFQLTVNVVGVLVSLIGSITLHESPLSSSQMLWVNLIMDTFASLALATDHPKEELLNRQPYGRNDDLITGYMKRSIVIQCIYQLIVMLVVLFFIDEYFGIPTFKHLAADEYSSDAAVHMTIIFQTFVLLQIFNEFNCRDLRRDILNPFNQLFRNSYFTGVMLVTIVIQYSLIEFGGQSFRCAPLTFGQHLFCIVLGAGGIVVGFLMKIIPESFYDKFSFFRDPTQTSVESEERREISRSNSNKPRKLSSGEEECLVDPEKQTNFNSQAL